MTPSAPPIDAAPDQPHPQIREFMRQFSNNNNNKDQQHQHVSVSGVASSEKDPIKLESMLLRLQLAGKTPPESLYQRAIMAYASQAQPNTAVRLMHEMFAKHRCDAHTMLTAYWDVMVGFYAVNDLVALRAIYKELLSQQHLADHVSVEFVASVLKLVYRIIADADVVLSMMDLTCEQLARSWSAGELVRMLLSTLTNEAQRGRVDAVQRLLARAGPLPDDDRLLAVPFNVLIVAHASAGNLDEALPLLVHVHGGHVPNNVRLYATTYTVVLDQLLQHKRIDEALHVASLMQQAGHLSRSVLALMRSKGPRTAEFKLELDQLRGENRATRTIADELKVLEDMAQQHQASESSAAADDERAADESTPEPSVELLHEQVSEQLIADANKAAAEPLEQPHEATATEPSAPLDDAEVAPPATEVKRKRGRPRKVPVPVS